MNDLSTPMDTTPQVGDTPIQAIARLAAGGASKEVVEQMMTLVDWDEKRRARADFNAAFSAAKQEFKKAKKSGHNNHLKSYYSTLEDYDEATKDALSAHGLSWRHVPATLKAEDGTEITSIRCILAHRSGHYEEAEMRAPSHSMTNNAVNKLQSVGIVAMYLKRLTLAAMLGIVSDSDLDNDGNGGGSSEKITDKQVADIKALMDEVEADSKGFLSYLSKAGKVTIETVENIPANMYSTAVAALEQKRHQKKKS